jgi:CHAT domain-containing protein/tetratricopeptide (TPR) repeat protein
MTCRLRLALIALFAVSNGFCQQADGGPERISSLVNEFFQVVAHKDLDAAMALWKADSAQFLATREDLRRLFAANTIRVVEARVERTTFSGNDRARAYVSTDLEVHDAANGTPVEGYGRKNKLFDCVKAAGVWKIVRYAPAEAELADALIAAGSAQDRARLTAGAKDPSTADLVRVLYRAAGEAEKNARPAEALRLSDIAIETAESLGDKVALARACVAKAGMLRDQSDTARAEPLAQRGLDLFREMKDRRGEATARRILGTIYLRNALFYKATRELEASLNLAKEIPDRATESAAHEGLGEVFRLKGDLGKAIESFQAALEIDRALADRPGEAAELLNLANVWQTKSEYQKALDLYRQSAAIDQELDDKQAQAIDWGNIGGLQDALSLYSEAIESLEKGRKLDIETGNRQGEAMVINGIGLVLMETGQLRPSLEKFAESVALATEIGDQGTQAFALSNLASAHQLLNEYGEALLAFQESLRLAHESGNPVEEAKSRGMIAGLYNQAGQFKEALDLFAQALPIFGKAGMKAEEAATLHNMATLYQEMGKYDEAAARYQESLRIKKEIPDPAGEAVTLGNLAQLRRAQGQLQASIETARAGAELAHKIGNPVAEALNTLAIADSLQLDGKPVESRKAYADALQLAESSGAQDAVAGAYIGLGSIDGAERNWNQAAADCEKAVDAVELMRSALDEPSLQVGFFGLNQKPYHCLLNSLLALNRNEEALRAAERARARTLIEVLGRAKVDIYKGLPAADREQLRKLDGAVAQLEFTVRQTPSSKLVGNLKAARQARDDLARVLYLKVPGLAVKRGEAGPVSLADLKTLLPDRHAALLEYTLGEDDSWLFVLRGPARANGRPELFVHSLKADREKISKLARGYWERLRKQGVEGPEGGELFRLLLAPAQAELADVSSLGIVPDGDLWLTPFAALRETDGSYLVESKAIYYAPSLTALRLMDRTAAQRRPALEARMRKGSPPFLLVGDTTFGASRKVDLPLRGSFSELPQTAVEVKGIAGLPGIRADILLGADATEAKVRGEAGKYPVIHFATHGFYDSANPMYSGIVLSQAGDSAGDSKDDGVWEAREIAEENLHTDLVVVSACDTARGEIFAGEGVMGLSWAFFVAGTSTSLLTDWEVDDTSTSLLMRQFYREWGIGNAGQAARDKAVALQRAQKWMLAQPQYADPYYWAPFVLIGVPR